MSGAAPFDAGIPVLTEVVKEIVPVTAPPPHSPARPAVWRTGSAATAPLPTPPAAVPAAATDLAAPAEPAGPGPAALPAEPADDGAASAPAAYVDLIERVMPAVPAAQRTGTGTDLAALEQALGERILQQLMPRVDALVAERLEQALQGFASSLRAGLGDSVAQAVADSVRQELAGLQAQKR